MGVADLDPDARHPLDIRSNRKTFSSVLAVQRSQERVVRRADHAQQDRAAVRLVVLQPAETLTIIRKPHHFADDDWQLLRIGEFEQYRRVAAEIERLAFALDWQS